MTKHANAPRPAAALTAATLSLMALPALSDTITGDLTVKDRLCVGSSCANGGVETFGNDDLKIKGATPWISFDDTSTTNAFDNDWLFRVNSGSASFFALEDTDANTAPFRVDAGAPTNALRVTNDGKIGLGTGLPQANVHLRSGSAVELRFEQDGSQGETPQSWEMSADASAFLIRDITNQLGFFGNIPFRINAGMGTSNALIIDSDGDIGLGVLSPEAALHVAGQSMLIKNAGRVNFTLSDTSDPGPDFRTQLSSGSARFSFVGTGKIEMELEQNGDLKIAGNYISSGTTLSVPDYVFTDDYALRPLAEVQSFIDAHSHLPEVPSAAQIAEDGLDMSEMQMTLLKKIEELTLYTLQQQAKLTELDAVNTMLIAEITALKTAQD